MVDNPKWQTGTNYIDNREGGKFPYTRSRISTRVEDGLVKISYDEEQIINGIQETLNSGQWTGVYATLELLPLGPTEGRIEYAGIRFEPPGQNGRRIMAELRPIKHNDTVEEYGITVYGRSAQVHDHTFNGYVHYRGDLGTVRQRYQLGKNRPDFNLAMVEMIDLSSGNEFWFSSSYVNTYFRYPDSRGSNGVKERKIIEIGENWVKFSENLIKSQTPAYFPLPHEYSDRFVVGVDDVVSLALVSEADSPWVNINLFRRLQCLPRYSWMTNILPDIPELLGESFTINRNLMTNLGDLPVVDITNLTPSQAVIEKVDQLVRFTKKTWGYKGGTI